MDIENPVYALFSYYIKLFPILQPVFILFCGKYAPVGFCKKINVYIPIFLCYTILVKIWDRQFPYLESEHISRQSIGGRAIQGSIRLMLAARFLMPFLHFERREYQNWLKN